MGKTVSKDGTEEENIIVQAGNSGGVSATATISTFEILGIVTFLGLVAMVAFLIYLRCKRKLEKRIRREIFKSRVDLGEDRV